MSSRDWSNIGAGACLPRWTRWAIPPLLVPLAGIAWLWIGWSRIPLRYGHPATIRMALHVCGFPIFAEGLVALLLGTMLAVWYGGGRPPLLSPMEKVLLASSYLLGALFTAIGLSAAAQLPAWPVAVAVPIAALSTIVFAIKGMSDADDVPDTTPDECWSMLGIYKNPKDPSLMVRARMGCGYTFNMANPWSHRIMIWLFGGIALLVGFLIWALR